MKQSKFKNTNLTQKREQKPEMMKEVKNYKIKKIGGK